MTDGKRLTPRLKRSLRKKLEQDTQAEKKARLLKRPEFELIPRIKGDVPVSSTVPRASRDPGSIMACLMEWCPLQADTAGIWSWGQQRQWSDDDWRKTIYCNLINFEKLTWSEIYDQKTGGKKQSIRKKHHDMNICDICKEAQSRWNEIGLDDHEMIFRFRLGNLPRLWGYRIYTKFFIIWWDKFHRICPTDK